MKKMYLGIDIGKAGGLVGIVDSKIIYKRVMPLVGGEDVDVFELARIFAELSKKYTVHVVTEKFAGFFGYGKNAAVSVARQSGFIESALILCKVPHTRFVPQGWQKPMFEGTKDMRKSNGQRDTKAMALLTANRIFPGETFLATERSKKPHDGLVDAALMAKFGERKGL